MNLSIEELQATINLIDASPIKGIDSTPVAMLKQRYSKELQQIQQSKTGVVNEAVRVLERGKPDDK